MLEVLIGICSGVAYAATGYLKSLKKDSKFEKFEPCKFTQSVVIGGIVGAVGYSLGISLEIAQQFVFDTGLVTIVENLKKFIWRKYLRALLNKIIWKRKN
jgi:hypothetical protein